MCADFEICNALLVAFYVFFPLSLLCQAIVDTNLQYLESFISKYSDSFSWHKPKVKDEMFF